MSDNTKKHHQEDLELQQLPDLKRSSSRSFGLPGTTRQYSSGEKLGRTESVRLKTLGEGPSAPDAAGRVAAEQGKEQEAAASGVPPADGLAKQEEHVDPGWRGWFDLLGAVTVNMLCYGMTNSYGVFQEYYLRNQLSDATPTAVSWIGALQLCLCPLLGCISGPLFDYGYLKSLVAIGGGLYVFSIMMTSIATQYWQFLLAHGLGVGLGMGIMFSPSVSTISHHFSRSRYRSVAYGIQAAGSCITGIVLPLMTRWLFPAVGFAWTMRIIGFIVLAFVILAFFALSRTQPPRKKLALLSPTVFRDPSYTLFVSGVGAISLAIYCPLTFGVTYGTANGLSTSVANYSLAITNGASLFGRILPLIAAQKLGAINTLIASSTMSGIMLFIWTKAKGTGGILAYGAIYGISSGAYAACVNPGAASFAPHVNQAGLYLGMCFFINSFFWLAGTPATAALIRGNDYFGASMFCGSVVLAGASLAVISRRMRVRRGEGRCI